MNKLTFGDYKQLKKIERAKVEFQGPTRSTTGLEFRRIEDYEPVGYCGSILSKEEEDSQCLSPQHCGNVAEFVAEDGGNVYHACCRHVPHKWRFKC